MRGHKLTSPVLPLALFVTSFACSATAFPSDDEPLNTRSTWDARDYPVFRGFGDDNETGAGGLGFQRMLTIDQTLYIAARDHVYAFDLVQGDMVVRKKLTWKTKAMDMENCAMRGKRRDECSNFIRVLVRRSDQTLLVCGTNAFNPVCRIYKSDTLQQEGSDMNGQARCPFDARQPHVGLFADGNLYSATMADFLASDAVIYRSLGQNPVLRTVKYDSKWLKEPHFLQVIEHRDYVYFFFREIAVEYSTLGRVQFSRVARVCRVDGGGSPRELDKYWTSYLKVRLNCSVPGDSIFYFDVLQSMTGIVNINGRPAVIGTFSTQANSIPGSAVCAFYMEDIATAFRGRFQEQRPGDAAWIPVPEDRVPTPRPGSCAGQGEAAGYSCSSHFPDETLSFIKSHPLLLGAVPSVLETPWFTTIGVRYRLTQVMAHTEAGPSRNHTLLFLASETGLLLKVLMRSTADAAEQGLLLEEMDVYSTAKCEPGAEDRRVMGLEMDAERRAIFVAFSGCVVRVPFSHCEKHSSCKQTCLAARDPDCGWVKPGLCKTLTHDIGSGYEQDIEFGARLPQETCEVAGVSQEQGNKESGQDVTVNLLVISTVCSFVLGGLVSGLLLSLYCRRALSKAKRSSKMADTCCPSPTISLPTLVKLNRLLELDGDAKEGKEDGCSPRMYTSFLVNGEPKNPQDQCPQLVGLPTPDATPELPVRRSTGLRNLNHNDAKDFGEVKACRLTGPIRRSPSGQNIHIPSAAVLPNNTHDRPVPALAPAHGARERDAITVRDEHKLPSALPIKEVALDTLMRQIQEMGGSTEAKLIDTAIVCPAVPLANRNQPRVPDTETAAYYTSCTLPRDSLVGTCPPGGQCRSAVEANGRSLLSRNPLPPSPGVTDHTASRPAPCEPGSLPPPGLARTDSQAGTGRRVRRAASIKPELLPKPLLPQSPGKPLS